MLPKFGLLPLFFFFYFLLLSCFSAAAVFLLCSSCRLLAGYYVDTPWPSVSEWVILSILSCHVDLNTWLYGSCLVMVSILRRCAGLTWFAWLLRPSYMVIIVPILRGFCVHLTWLLLCLSCTVIVSIFHGYCVHLSWLLCPYFMVIVPIFHDCYADLTWSCRADEVVSICSPGVI